jgi:hypothetical protein
LAAVQVVPPQLFIPEEPPIEIPRPSEPLVPAPWNVTWYEIITGIASGLSQARNFVINFLIRNGVLNRLAADFLTQHVDLSIDIIWEIAYWIYKRGDYNISVGFWEQVLFNFIQSYHVPVELSEPMYNILREFQDKGFFILGDMFAAMARGWTASQVVEWVVALYTYDFFNGWYYWPDDWNEAKRFLEEARGFENIGIEENEEPPGIGINNHPGNVPLVP